ncbi:MAG: RNA polymerase sigma factor [Phycisphaerales bacterium]
MEQSDKSLIQLCLDGRPDEFRHLISRYQSAVSAYLASKLRNKSIAEEAAQETFVRAYFSLADIKKHESFPAWLFGIANNVAKEQMRSKCQCVDLDSIDDVPDKKNIENDFELQQAFAKLPDSYREIILLRFYANQSCQQIAANLNMPIGSVTKTLSRAYEQLRQIFENQK